MELFQFTSTWLVVALTWTRVIAVTFPFRTRGCQNCSAVITIATLTCISSVISLTKLYSGGTVLLIVLPFSRSLRSDCATCRYCDIVTITMLQMLTNFSQFCHKRSFFRKPGALNMSMISKTVCQVSKKIRV